MPLAIDLFCGLHGWSNGLVAEGYDVVAYDHEDKCELFGLPPPDGPVAFYQRDVRLLHGALFCHADLIVASPPCQEYSYRAMPWTRAKALPPPSNELFETCFRLQREACEASGRHIPMVVENVKGAQPFVGRARAHYGSYYLWGDVPALMPLPHANPDYKTNGAGCFRDSAIKNTGGSWFKVGHYQLQQGQNPDGRPLDTGTKVGGDWFRDPIASAASRSKKRKFASALIARIPIELARYIGRTYYPR